MKHHSYKAAVKKLAQTGEVEIKSTVSVEEFAEAFTAVLKDTQKEVTLPGFRKGAAPEKMIREKIGEAALLKEAAEQAISHAYGHILEAEKIDAIGHPKVSITKIAEGNPLEFTIVTAVIPEVKAFDYKKIAAEENKKPTESVTVTDEELKKEQEKVKDLTKEDLVKAKEYRAHEKRRLALIESITKHVDVVVPEILVQSETDQMIAQISHDVSRMGMKFEDYLKHLKKSEDELRKEWHADAMRKVKLDLALAHIAKEEKIMPDKNRIEEELKHAKTHYKDIDERHARNYFAHVLLTQAVFEFLEKQK